MPALNEAAVISNLISDIKTCTSSPFGSLTTSRPTIQRYLLSRRGRKFSSYRIAWVPGAPHKPETGG